MANCVVDVEEDATGSQKGLREEKSDSASAVRSVKRGFHEESWTEFSIAILDKSVDRDQLMDHKEKNKRIQNWRT